MSTTFVTGKNSTLSIATAGSGTLTYTPIDQVKTTNYTGTKLDTDDITNMSSPGAFREYAPTLNDAGQLAVSGVFDPADPGQLMFSAAFNAQTLISVKHQYAPAQGQTTGFLRTFSGYVVENTLDLQFDKTSTFNATIKITGPITDTPGS